MARGGKRAGAGRPPGSTNAATDKRRDVAAKALEDGITPLEVMLDNMRWAQSQAEKVTEVEDALKSYRAAACEWAKQAAPYVHPKLSTIEHKGDKDNPVAITQIELVSGEGKD